MGITFKKSITQLAYDKIIEEETKKCEIAKMTPDETASYLKDISRKYHIV